MKKLLAIMTCILLALVFYNGTCATTEDAKDPEQSGLMPTDQDADGPEAGDPDKAEPADEAGKADEQPAADNKEAADEPEAEAAGNTETVK